jgi:hypothetical protein
MAFMGNSSMRSPSTGVGFSALPRSVSPSNQQPTKPGLSLWRDELPAPRPRGLPLTQPGALVSSPGPLSLPLLEGGPPLHGSRERGNLGLANQELTTPPSWSPSGAPTRPVELSASGWRKATEQTR